MDSDAGGSGGTLGEVYDFDLLEPFPDIHGLFVHYSKLYFNDELGAASVEWSSKRMTLCAGTCAYDSRTGSVVVKLSEPILKYRTSRDLKMVLLHEMIHAKLFVDGRWRDDSEDNYHGPIFKAFAKAINTATCPDHQRPPGGYNITVTHDWIDEVNIHRKHKWTCVKCGAEVRRAMNRAPQPADCATTRGSTARGSIPCSDDRCLHCTHLRTCGGAFEKTAEPEGYVDKKKRKAEKQRGQGHRLGGDSGGEAGGGGSSGGGGQAKRSKGGGGSPPPGARRITDWLAKPEPGGGSGGGRSSGGSGGGSSGGDAQRSEDQQRAEAGGGIGGMQSEEAGEALSPEQLRRRCLDAALQRLQAPQSRPQQGQRPRRAAGSGGGGHGTAEQQQAAGGKGTQLQPAAGGTYLPAKPPPATGRLRFPLPPPGGSKPAGSIRMPGGRGGSKAGSKAAVGGSRPAGGAAASAVAAGSSKPAGSVQAGSGGGGAAVNGDGRSAAASSGGSKASDVSGVKSAAANAGGVGGAAAAPAAAAGGGGASGDVIDLCDSDDEGERGGGGSGKEQAKQAAAAAPVLTLACPLCARQFENNPLGTFALNAHLDECLVTGGG